MNFVDLSKNVAGKKLLILAANEETNVFVKKARELGVKTIVTDHIIGSPAKSNADKSYDINGKDIENLVRIAQNEMIDGVMVGVADPLVMSYMKLAKELGLPCYISDANVYFFTDKSVFKQACASVGIKTVEQYYEGKNYEEAVKKAIVFPCIVKPSRGRGGKGVSLCKGKEMLEDQFLYAQKYSDDGSVIIEKYMNCPDIVVHYYIVNGKKHLIAVSDHETVRTENAISPVTYANVYPSKLTDLFIQKCDSKFEILLKKLKINNGLLEMQVFWDGKEFYPYDPTCIISGEAYGPIFKKVLGIDLVENFVKYALTGEMSCRYFPSEGGVVPDNRSAQSIWILLRPGVITHIEGLSEIDSVQGVLGHVQRLSIGDIITEDMFETEKAVLGRIWVADDSFEEMKDLVAKIRRMIKVFDEKGNNMIWEG